jgi:hypothetical protein
MKIKFTNLYKLIKDKKKILKKIYTLIKNSEQIISDNEIRTNVLIAINEFFAIEAWNNSTIIM